MTYDEWESAAAEYLGLDPLESAELAEQLTAAGYDLAAADVDDERFWGEVAQSEEYEESLPEILGDYDEYESPYELDPYFPDDDWLEADVEWEMTAETDDSYLESH